MTTQPSKFNTLRYVAWGVINLDDVTIDQEKQLWKQITREISGHGWRINLVRNHAITAYHVAFHNKYRRPRAHGKSLRQLGWVTCNRWVALDFAAQVVLTALERRLTHEGNEP